MKQNGRCLEKVSPEKTVAPSGYLAIDVSFARLAAPRRKTQIGADAGCRSEARWIIDCMAERQGCHNADARNRHQATRRFIRLRQPANFVVKLALLFANLLMNRQKRSDHAEELMIFAQ